MKFAEVLYKESVIKSDLLGFLSELDNEYESAHKRHNITDVDYKLYLRRIDVLRALINDKFKGDKKTDGAIFGTAIRL